VLWEQAVQVHPAERSQLHLPAPTSVTAPIGGRLTSQHVTRQYITLDLQS